MASSSSSSSSKSTTNLPRKHHVFLSFRGEDTRFGYTSHLHAALERKNISTFIDNNLKRGEEISDSLVKAIEDSMLSVIIFSQNYASSKWCLDELKKILECRKIRGQIAIPIFYEVDPSDVRKQSGSFGDAFAELVKRKAMEIEEEQCFRAALNEAANISGHDSRKSESESKFIEEIVKDIFNKLSKMYPIHSMNLVGIDDRIRDIESVLEIESKDVRIVGIWGMGGIGKTTIAGAAYNKICTEFEAFLFVSNIREELTRRTVVDLQRSFVSRLLDQEIRDMGPLSFGNHFVKDGLRHRRVLIVFDDVDSSMPLQELLLGQHDSFGPGSRILVTSRDRHVLEQVVDATYGVHALNHIESLQLLKSKAFKKIDPISDHKDLLDMMVNYAKGNPLALVVLGSALCDRSIEDWYSKLNGLGQGQDVDILKVLKISYDGLTEEEKNVFLDIAYYFRGMDRYHVTPMLQKKSSSVHFCISVLIDKSLIIENFGNTLQMHDLLRDMAYSIVNEESKSPRKRSRLVDPEDIYDVLKKRKGREAVKGVCLDMPASSKMRLKSDVFVGMRSLEFLIIKGNTSKVKLPRHGLEYLPKKLRYFRWDEYPSRSLAQKFCAQNLVDFDFPRSKVEELWSGRQELINLRKINLSFSHRLTTLPDLSEAKKLEHVYLDGCSSLIEVPSYFQYFEHLKELYLNDCYNLQSLPRKINSNNIKLLSLQDCSNINKFPNISGNIGSLYLDGIDIEELPSSIQFLRNLQFLYMGNCKKLSRLPISICKLKFLEELDMSGCSKLESFPEIKEPMESLRLLALSETAITELPSSIRFLTNLGVLYLTNCKKLFSLPNNICELVYLTRLDIDGCSKLKSLPKNMEPMESLQILHLSETAIRELPELPPSFESLLANNCESLEIISSSTLGDPVRELYFANCLKVDEKALTEDMQLKIQFGKIADSFQMVLPGSEIPQWFNDQSRGSSITIQFPSDPPNLKAIAFCLVLVHPYEPDAGYTLKLSWEAKITNGEHDVFRSSYWFSIGKLKISKLDHMYLWYHNIMKITYGIHDGFSKYLGHEVRFEFNAEVTFGIERDFKVKRCGVHLLFDENRR